MKNTIKTIVALFSCFCALSSTYASSDSLINNPFLELYSKSFNTNEIKQNNILELIVLSDEYYMEENTSLTLDIYSNDTNLPETGSLLVSQPNNGIVTIEDINNTPDDPRDDIVTYTPNKDFIGEDNFTYTLCNKNNTPSLCETAEVTMFVEKPSDNSNNNNITATPPLISDYTLKASINQPTYLRILDDAYNGVDWNYDNLILTEINSTPIAPNKTINIDGVDIYYNITDQVLNITPLNPESNSIILIYTVENKETKLSSEGLITLEIAYDPPTTKNYKEGVTINQPLSLNIISESTNGVNETSSNLIISEINSSPISADETININGVEVYNNSENGALLITPINPENDNIELTYTVENIETKLSSVGSITLEITYDPPTTKNYRERAVINQSLLFNIIDETINGIDGTSSNLAITEINSSPISAEETININGVEVYYNSSNGSLQITPLKPESNTNEFNYTIKNSQDITAQGSIILDIISPPETINFNEFTSLNQTTILEIINNSTNGVDGTSSNLFISKINSTAISPNKTININGIDINYDATEGTLQLTPLNPENNTLELNFTVENMDTKLFTEGQIKTQLASAPTVRNYYEFIELGRTPLFLPIIGDSSNGVDGTSSNLIITDINGYPINPNEFININGVDIYYNSEFGYLELYVSFLTHDIELFFTVQNSVTKLSSVGSIMLHIIPPLLITPKDDTATTPPNTPVIIDVLANDLLPEDSSSRYLINIININDEKIVRGGEVVLSDGTIVTLISTPAGDMLSVTPGNNSENIKFNYSAIESFYGFYSAEVTVIIENPSLSTNNYSDNISNAVQIYPNPFSNELNVSIKNNITGADFQIIDSNGKVLKNKSPINKKSTIQVNYSPGIYFIKISKDSQEKVFKVIKK